MSNDNKKTVVIILGFVLSISLGFITIGEDVSIIIRWFLGLFVMGMAALPLNMLVFKPLGKDGYYYTKVLGVAVSGYIMWLLSSLKLIPFNERNSYISVVLLLILGYACLIVTTKSKYLSKLVRKYIGINDIALRELILFNLLLIISVFLSLKIPGTETERLMDFGFMKTLSMTKYMPPLDMWASGHTINYYYYGQYLCTYICKIAMVRVEEGYTLSMATIYCLCAILSYTAVKSLLSIRLGKKLSAVLGGLLAAILVSTSGNMHYVVFYRLMPALWDLLRIPGDKPSYWMADSTRYIGYIPVNDADKTIHEFPFYSFLIGDLHAHVIDICIVLTIIGLLISFTALYKDKNCSNDRLINVCDILNPHIITLGFLIGIASMTNFWDYPIYYCVAGCIILMVDIIRMKDTRRVIITIALQGAFVWISAQIINMPFRAKFENMTSGIGLATTHSLIHQLIVLWGLPLFTCFVFYLYLYFIKSRMNKIYLEDILVLLFTLCGIGLVLMPEIVYVRDIYESGFPRANTMFKLTYQAYIILGLSAAYIITTIIISMRDYRHKAAQIVDFKILNDSRWIYNNIIVILFLYICTSFYSYTASHQWYGNNSLAWTYKGLDSTSTIRTNMESDQMALEWIENNLKEQEIVLEAPGLSYTTGSTVSALTGHPTVTGWQTHEWLWHNSYDFVYLRELDVDNIYTSTDISVVRDNVNKYDVEYIFVGKNEYTKYGDIHLDNLLQIGDVVFSDGAIDNPTMIIKVNQ